MTPSTLYIAATVVILICVLVAILKGLNYISYGYIKRKVLHERVWDLNICCGKSDGRGINADIIRHDEVPNFELIQNIYSLPYADKQFKSTLCSHTMEHVEDPVSFFNELKRVSENVTILVPPLWDIGAVLNVLEHKWVFLSLKTRHSTLPKHVRLPLSAFVHAHFGQKFRG